MTFQWLIYLNSLIDNNTTFYIRKVKPTCYLKHFAIGFAMNFILLNHLKCPYLSKLDLNWFIKSYKACYATK